MNFFANIGIEITKLFLRFVLAVLDLIPPAVHAVAHAV
jgi:hypothetical protein